MNKKFIVACHVSTIPKSPPKIIRETYADSYRVSFYYSNVGIKKDVLYTSLELKM